MLFFKEYIAQDGIDYFVVEMPEDQILESALLNEGRWVETKMKGYMQRVDAENQAVQQLRHVHVAKSKHIKNKTMQVSWNQDTTKHDRKKFNSNIGSLEVVQSIARQALGLSPLAKLEESSRAEIIHSRLLNESMNIGESPGLFKLRIC